MQFFGILSRNFITSFVHQLPKGAVSVYAYLRTWLISPVGQPSDWRPLSQTKIAAELNMDRRYVRRSINLLIKHRLIEKRTQFHEVPGMTERPQGPNLYRVLPEPGFPVEEEAPAGPKAQPAADMALIQAITGEVEVVLASVPEWAARALVDAADSRQSHLDTAEFCETTDDPVMLQHGPEQLATWAAEHRAAAVEVEAEIAVCTAVAKLEPAEAAAHPRFTPLVVETLANRAARALRWRGRQRTRITREVVLVVLREELALRGVTLPDTPTIIESRNSCGPGD